MPEQFWRLSGSVLVSVGLAALLLAATIFGPYDWFIDELYYLACTQHLAWGFVDHPPLSIAILAAFRALFGESMLAVRLPAALAAAASVLVAGRIARELGGGRRAEWLAAVATAVSPMTFVMGSFFSMNAFELLLWPLLALVTLILVQRQQPRLWLLWGALLGLALLNKHTSMLFGGALVIGVLSTPARRHYATRWPWLGAAIAAAIVTPNLLWQWANDWPSLEFYRNAQLDKNIPTSVARAIVNQVIFQGVGAVPLWIAGAMALLRPQDDRSRRALGIAFVLLFAVIVAAGSSRPDRIGGAYAMVFAAGAVAIEGVTRRWRTTWPFSACMALLLASGVVAAPVTLPLFAPETVATYTRTLKLVPSLERGSTSPIPQWLADRTGWDTFVDRIASYYRQLPPQDQERVVIYAPDYGHAGALELLGPARGIPKPYVISNHNTYWMWGRGLSDPQVLIAVGSDPKDLELIFRDVQALGRDTCDYCMSWRNNVPIYLARDPKVPVAPFWEQDRNFR